MARNIKEQPRTKHLMAFFALHSDAWISCSDEGLLKHFNLVYNGSIPANKKLSSILSSFYKEGLLKRKGHRVVIDNTFNKWKGKTRIVFFYQVK